MKMIMRMIMVMILDTFSVYFLIVFWSFEAWCGQVWPGLVLGALPGRVAALRRGVVGSAGTKGGTALKEPPRSLEN